MKLRMALISVLLAAGAGDALGQQRPGGNGPLPGDPGYGGGARQQQMPPPPRLTGGWVTNWGRSRREPTDWVVLRKGSFSG